MFFRQGAKLCGYQEKTVEALDKTEQTRTQIPVMTEY